MTPGESYRVLRPNRFGKEPHNLTQAPGDARNAEPWTNRPAWEPAPLRAARQRPPISASRLPTANDSDRGGERDSLPPPASPAVLQGEPPREAIGSGREPGRNKAPVPGRQRTPLRGLRPAPRSRARAHLRGTRFGPERPKAKPPRGR